MKTHTKIITTIIVLFVTIGTFSQVTNTYTSVHNVVIKRDIADTDHQELFSLATKIVAITEKESSRKVEDIETARMKLDLIQIKQNQEIIRLLKKIADEK